MGEEETNDTKWPPVLASAEIAVEAKPLVKYARPIRANYTPRKYKAFHVGGKNGECASFNTKSSLNIESKPESCETKRALSSGGTSDKPVVNKTPVLKRKDECLTLCIDVEPIHSLLPKRLSLDECSPTVSENKKELTRAMNTSVLKNDAEIIKGKPDVAINGEEKQKRPVRRPRKKQDSYHSKLDKSPSKTRRMVTTPEKSSPTGSPTKQARLTPKNSSPNEKRMSSRAKSWETGSAADVGSVSSASPTKHECNICNKLYLSQARLQTHMYWHVKRKQFECNVCKKIFKDFGHFARHQQMHRKTLSTVPKSPQPASKVDTVASNDQALKAKSPSEQKQPHKCKICLQTFAYLEELKLHMVKHGQTARKYRCIVCSRKFVSFSWLKKHALRCHDITKVNKQVARLKDGNIKSAKPIHRDNLQKHAADNGGDIVKHKNNRPQCCTCRKTFTDKSCLIKHKRMHTGEKPFECHVCKEKIRWRYQLHDHCKSVHGEENPYKCGDCGKLFRYVRLLQRHKEMHEVDEPETGSSNQDEDVLHKCDKCSRTFKSRHGLGVHLRWHKEGKDEPQPTTNNGSNTSNSTTPTKIAPPKTTGGEEKEIPPRRQSRRLRVSRSPPKPQEHVPKGTTTNDTTSQGSTSQHPTPQDPITDEPKQSTSPMSDCKSKKAPCHIPEQAPRNWIKFTIENGEHVLRCGLCTSSERRFSRVASVRKHVGMVHRDYTENLAEPPGLYDDALSQPPTTSSSSSLSSSSQVPNPPRNACTCSGKGKTFVYKNNKLTHLASSCPVHKDSYEPKKIPKDPVLRCKHCDEEFDSSSREKFQEHELSHELEAAESTCMAYACFECEVEFATANEMMDHYEKNH